MISSKVYCMWQVRIFIEVWIKRDRTIICLHLQIYSSGNLYAHSLMIWDHCVSNKSVHWIFIFHFCRTIFRPCHGKIGEHWKRISLIALSGRMCKIDCINSSSTLKAKIYFRLHFSVNCRILTLAEHPFYFTIEVNYRLSSLKKVLNAISCKSNLINGNG